MYQDLDLIADNFLQVDQRGALCLFIEHDDSPLAVGGFFEAEGFLMCKYPSVRRLSSDKLPSSANGSPDACLAVKLKDGNDTLIPYLGAEEFITETHFIWYYDRKTPQEQGKVWKFDFSGVQHGHGWGPNETVTLPIPAWVVKMDHLDHDTTTIVKSTPDAYTESQLDTGVAKLDGGHRLQHQFRLKDKEPETDEAYNNGTIRYDLDDDGNPKEFIFHAGIAQYGRSSVRDPAYTGTMKNPFWQRARFGAIWPGGYFWEDYYDDHKSNAPDWYQCAWYDEYGRDDTPESIIYTIKCWRYMDRRLQTWRYVCIDVSEVLDFASNGFHTTTAKLVFNNLRLNSVAPAEDLDLHPLEYLKEQEA